MDGWVFNAFEMFSIKSEGKYYSSQLPASQKSLRSPVKHGAFPLLATQGLALGPAKVHFRRSRSQGAASPEGRAGLPSSATAPSSGDGVRRTPRGPLPRAGNWSPHSERELEGGLHGRLSAGAIRLVLHRERGLYLQRAQLQSAGRTGLMGRGSSSASTQKNIQTPWEGLLHSFSLPLGKSL